MTDKEQKMDAENYGYSRDPLKEHEAAKHKETDDKDALVEETLEDTIATSEQPAGDSLSDSSATTGGPAPSNKPPAEG